MKRGNICGHRVKLARIDKKLKQVELSAMLSVDYDFELTQHAISNIETGGRIVSDIELIALAKALDVKVSWLLYGDKGEK
jgi:transcriptional regulator with XRE-family HTH domain